MIDNPLSSFVINILVNKKFLILPVSNSAEKVTVQLKIGEKVAREFSIELALSDPVDWWAFYDIQAFDGKELELLTAMGDIPASSIEWLKQSVSQSDEPVGFSNLYQEQYRPQFHFTSRRGWNNDPNGLVFHQGEWHLYYQHNPFGIRWGNMHWGHAVSQNLVNWEELPVALYQNSLNDMIFSGGGLVDATNSAGFQQSPDPAMIVAFTSTGRGECLAYSNDRGRTLIEWPGNPFLTHFGRDPKIIWYEPDQKWVMIIYEELVEYDRISADLLGYAIYSSKDLKHWERHSFLPGYWECPELFQLPVDGKENQASWVIHGCVWGKAPSSTSLIGQFDGKSFVVEEINETSHYGPHFYASQVFNQATDGRVIMIGWLSGAEYPGMPFSQGMTVPLELSLRTTSTGTRLCFNPVKELEMLRGESSGLQNVQVVDANALLAGEDHELLEIDISSSTQQNLTLDIRGYPVEYKADTNEVSFCGRAAQLPAGETELRLRVLVDRSVTELFVNDGLASFASMTIFPDPARPVQICEGERIYSLAIHQLRGIWE